LSKKRNITRFFVICFIAISFSFPQFARSQPGTWVWANGVHSNAAEWVNDIAVDPVSGDIVAVGVFNGGLSAFYGSNFVGAVGGGFITKYDASGNVLWSIPIGNNQDDACNGVAIDATGNIYVTGYVQIIAQVTGTSGPYTQVSSVGGKDVFLLKYNPAGVLQWAVSDGGSSDDEGTAVCVNATSVFVTGYFTNSGNFGGISTVSN